jgi:2'-5' RNA ligase
VIWVGLRGDLPAVESLQAQVEAVATRLGWVPESRPFQPHLTLGRVVNPRSHLGDSIALLDMSEHQETIPHTRVALVRSHLGPAGARYEDLAIWELGS